MHIYKAPVEMNKIFDNYHFYNSDPTRWLGPSLNVILKYDIDKLFY